MISHIYVFNVTLHVFRISFIRGASHAAMTVSIVHLHTKITTSHYSPYSSTLNSTKDRMTIGISTPIWLDCDPGNDDAFAILLAAFHPKFNLVGISTVYGNASNSSTTHNALGLLDVLGIDQHEVKVYSGESKPLLKPATFAPEIHGPTGIGGAKLPTTPRNKESKDETYLEAMRKAILKYAGEICVICTGTLTNMAILIKAYPELKSKIRFVSIMGGALNKGNATKYAEFNVHCDPRAAAEVLNDEELSGKTILAGLNITHKAVATMEVRKNMYNETDPQRNSQIRKLFYDIAMFYAEAYRVNHNITVGPPVHDPLAVFLTLALINKRDNLVDDINFTYLRRKLKVVQEGEREGETQIANGDLDELSEEENGVYVGLDVNVELFWNYVLEALHNADHHVANYTQNSNK